MEYSPDMSHDIIKMIQERLYQATSNWIEQRACLHKAVSVKAQWQRELDRDGGCLGFDPRMTRMEQDIERERKANDRADRNRLYWQAIFDYTVETFIRDNRKPKDHYQYSVLLLYPDYMSDSYGHETYYALVTAKDRHQAVNKARMQAIQGNDIIDLNTADDFHCLLVTRGHHKMIYDDNNQY